MRPNLKDIPKDYILTPHGPVHKDCVHQTVGEKVTHEPCKHPRPGRPDGGWIGSAMFMPSTPLGSMTVRFKVPEPPRNPESVIYLFPAAQDAAMTTILQPVLQWGDNRKFGGNHWTIASWYCTTEGKTLVSPAIEVNPGDMIEGTLRMIKESPVDCNWLIETKVVSDTLKKNSTLIVEGLESLLLFIAAGALEAYVLNEEKTLPLSGCTTFTIVELTDLNNMPFRADWVKSTPFGLSECNVRVNEDRSVVTLTYH